MLELNHIHKLYNPGTVNEICLFDDFNLKLVSRLKANKPNSGP